MVGRPAKSASQFTEAQRPAIGKSKEAVANSGHHATSHVERVASPAKTIAAIKVHGALAVANSTNVPGAPIPNMTCKSIEANSTRLA